MNYEINAENRSLGRVATEAVVILRGKNLPSFEQNIAPKVKVKITNISKIKLTGNKLKEKTYKRYTGYPSGLREIPFQKMFERDPEETFRKVVKGMLPANKLRNEMLKNLTVEK